MPAVAERIILTKIVPNGRKFDVVDLDTDRVLANWLDYGQANAVAYRLADPDAPLFHDDGVTGGLVTLARVRADA